MCPTLKLEGNLGWECGGGGENQVSLARQVSPAPFPQPGSRSRSRAGPVGTRCFLRALELLLRASLPLSPGTEPRKGGGDHLPAGPPRGGPAGATVP